jgi:hypothetical protein
MSVVRHHLTIAEKNRLRRHHRERPELTQEQLREWAHAQFGKWVGRSTIGKIAGSPPEQSANPQAKRVQSGRYPDMEQKLFELIVARQQQQHFGQDEPPVLSEGQLWEKANELLGPGQSVSVGWVQRFKKRHGLHRSQRAVRGQQTVEECTPVVEHAVAVESEEEVPETGTEVTGQVVDVAIVAMEQTSTSSPTGAKRPRQESNDGDESEGNATPLLKRASSSSPPARTAAGRKQFVSADDILLLTQVLTTKPWAHPHVMDGWQEVCQQLREHNAFTLDKSAGACQARVALLLDHLRARNVAALRKSGTVDEYERKRGLLVEMLRQQTAFDEFQEDMRKRSGEPSPPPNVTQHDAAVAKVGEVAAAIAVAEATGEADRDGQRRLELLEIRMERELAEQRRHADEQVRRLERLQRAQLEAQQNQHAQLLSTIQQQQAMMLDLIRTVAAQAKSKD